MPDRMSDGLGRCKLMTVLALNAAIAFVCNNRSAPAESSIIPAQVIIAESRFTVTNAPAQRDLVALVVDFPPGAWTSLHTHGGQAINLVLDGTITFRQGSVDRPYRLGEAWSDSSGAVHAAGNIGPGRARLLTNFLLPQGAPQTTAIQASQFEPSVTNQARFSVPPLPAETEILQQVVDLSSGSWVEKVYDGFAVTIVVEGEVTRKIDGEQKTYRAGEAWSARDGASVLEGSTSLIKARLFTAYLVPRKAGQQ
jgi:quercetin dioxygenase-like cupin family protein